MLRLVVMVKIHTNVSNIEAYKPYKLLTIFLISVILSQMGIKLGQMTNLNVII